MTERATQPELLREASANDNAGPITCLGLTFADAAGRRAYFTTRLREYLQDPNFRAVEGFPRGGDEDILALSDPPYYTACPNPFLPEIMAEWQTERAALHANLGLSDETYHREPFATDVSEGKNDPIYNAHSYHTKVPHKAIMRYILHYTEPGDIVFDGFCGTGMTGVAAQLCGDRKTVESLGYRVEADGMIYDDNRAISRLGARKAVLNDLSPAATFIAYNYNTPVDVAAFEREVERILQEVGKEYGWMYETTGNKSNSKGKVNYVIWSDVFLCSNCNTEVVFWQPGIEQFKKPILTPRCQTCGMSVEKRRSERAFEMVFDAVDNQIYKRVKRTPVMINVVLPDKTRIDKVPDVSDIDTINQIETLSYDEWIPTDKLSKGERYYKDGLHLINLQRIDQFFTKRNLIFLAKFRRICSDNNFARLGYLLSTSVLTKTASLMHNIGLKDGRINLAGALPNVIYIPSTIAERNISFLLEGKTKDFSRAFAELHTEWGKAYISTGSSTWLGQISSESIDYVFVDPPFGSNLLYSELNEIWEAWLKIKTSPQNEAVISKHQNKALFDYQTLMERCFAQFFRILKHGRWMTIEFHNSSNSVWISIQEALSKAGFVVAAVKVLDKEQGTRNQMTQVGSVNKDLVITAYKPTTAFEQQFLSHAGTPAGVWDFVRQYLVQVPPVVINNGILETVAERQNYLLFDRMVAYHIQRGIAVPMGAAQFYAGLDQYFAEQDGMYFLPDQVAEYNKARLEYGVVAQMNLFVSDEKSAINWLRYQLQAEPMSFQQIQPRFLQELHQARHEDLPDLKILLEQSFLPDDEGRWYVPDPNRAEDLEKLRLRGLLREFAQYKESKKKLRQFRSEAVRAGFSHAWHERDYATIVEVAERLPEQVLQEDPELLMYYDNASLRAGS